MLLVLPSPAHPEDDVSMLWLSLGAFVITPIGIGTLLAGAVGSCFLRQYSLRTLFIVTACCGALMAAFLNLEWSWSGDQIGFEKTAASFQLTVQPTSQSTSTATDGLIWTTRTYVFSTPVLLIDYLFLVRWLFLPCR
jgi:hypothetical protein